MSKHQIAAAVMLFLAAAAWVAPSPAYAARATATSAATRGFVVRGRVFCDTCRAGFETPATTYLSGAKVNVECRSRISGTKTFEGVTDKTGTYNIPVADEHEHETCETVLVSSPQGDCASLVPGRERARVFLTRNNGIASDTRLANAMGFQKNTPLAECAQLLKQYEQYDV